jgi:Cys-rich four helix bundle protein (predicted Tat secretion target)
MKGRPIVEGVELGRREVVVGAAAVVAAAALASPARTARGAEAAAAASLSERAGNCVQVGEECLSHCLGMFSSGDTSLAACARSVHEMIPICTALARLASLESKHLKALSGPCATVCESCERECRKHEKDHEVCRACADACKDLQAALAKV